MAARAGLAQALWGPLVPAPTLQHGAGAGQEPGGTLCTPIPVRGYDQAWGGFTAPRVLPRAGGTITAPPTSMGAEAAGAEQRFPIKAVYLAPALSTPKQAGLKVNSLSIPYCQLIHHPGRAGAARAPVGLGRVTKGSCVCVTPHPLPGCGEEGKWAPSSWEGDGEHGGGSATIAGSQPQPPLHRVVPNC